MILSTSLRSRRRTCELTTSARSARISTFPGEEIELMSGVVRPMIPILLPPRLTTTDGTMRPLRTSRRSSGMVSSKPRLAVMNGMSRSTPWMYSARRACPKSNSWFPIVIAS